MSRYLGTLKEYGTYIKESTLGMVLYWMVRQDKHINNTWKQERINILSSELHL
jgi:hypothetical protein